MGNRFFYYINHRNRYVRIHRENCRFCNLGNGVQNNILGNINGLWSNSYETYKEVLKEAIEAAILQNNNNTVNNCRKCNPQI